MVKLDKMAQSPKIAFTSIAIGVSLLVLVACGPCYEDSPPTYKDKVIECIKNSDENTFNGWVVQQCNDWAESQKRKEVECKK